MPGDLTYLDTSRQAEQVMLAIYREMPAWRKLALVDDAIRTSRQLAYAGIRTRHPDESPAQARRRLLGLLLGEELARRIYDPVNATRAARQ